MSSTELEGASAIGSGSAATNTGSTRDGTARTATGTPSRRLSAGEDTHALALRARCRVDTPVERRLVLKFRLALVATDLTPGRGWDRGRCSQRSFLAPQPRDTT